MKEAVRKAGSHTLFRRERGTYSLDMWVPQPVQASPQTSTANEAPQQRSNNGMEVDALALDHYMVPAAEWKDYFQFRCRQLSASPASSVFRRQA